MLTYYDFDLDSLVIAPETPAEHELMVQKLLNKTLELNVWFDKENNSFQYLSIHPHEKEMSAIPLEQDEIDKLYEEMLDAMEVNCEVQID